MRFIVAIPLKDGTGVKIVSVASATREGALLIASNNKYSYIGLLTYANPIREPMVIGELPGASLNV